MRALLVTLALALPAAAAAQTRGIVQTPAQRGRALFDHAFHRADGLGAPEFNANSCRACHSDPAMGGAGPLEVNVSRFGQEIGGVFTDLPGGQILSKLRPPHVVLREAYPATANVFEQRQTPTLFGTGLIDTIPDEAIIANEDPNDVNADGVRGVARRVVVGGMSEIGRFGWKAQIPRLLDFVRDATFNELGLTTTDDGRGLGARTDGDTAPDPELSDEQVADLDAFMRSLPAPARAGSTDPRVQNGEAVFTAVGCAKCHVPSLPGAGGPVLLFSDLLLHNVMPAGFRGMSENGAGSGVYRTPPLWGVRDTAPYMHDGRAETLAQAIGMHAGEAVQVMAAYGARSAEDRANLLLFLQDL